MLSKAYVMVRNVPAKPGRVSSRARRPMQRILAQPLRFPPYACCFGLGRRGDSSSISFMRFALRFAAIPPCHTGPLVRPLAGPRINSSRYRRPGIDPDLRVTMPDIPRSSGSGHKMVSQMRARHKPRSWRLIREGDRGVSGEHAAAAAADRDQTMPQKQRTRAPD
jgi:hypothetical protein